MATPYRDATAVATMRRAARHRPRQTAPFLPYQLPGTAVRQPTPLPPVGRRAPAAGGASIAPGPGPGCLAPSEDQRAIHSLGHAAIGPDPARWGWTPCPHLRHLVARCPHPLRPCGHGAGTRRCSKVVAATTHMSTFLGDALVRTRILVARPRLPAEVDNVVCEAEDHDGHTVDAEREGQPLGGAMLVAEQPEIELASATHAAVWYPHCPL